MLIADLLMCNTHFLIINHPVHALFLVAVVITQKLFFCLRHIVTVDEVNLRMTSRSAFPDGFEVIIKCAFIRDPAASIALTACHRQAVFGDLL